MRFFNVYGPNQNPSSPYSGVISILVDRYKTLLRNEEAAFTIFGDGKQSRDFVYIDDVIQALLLVAQSEEALGTQFNVGTGTSTSLLELIDVIDETLNVKLPVKFEEERAGDIKDSRADVSRILSLEYKFKHHIASGIKACFCIILYLYSISWILYKKELFTFYT